MKKVLTFLSALGFLSTSTLSVIACGVGDGPVIDLKIDAPKAAKDGQSPPDDYVFNNIYNYQNKLAVILITTGAQLTVDKIKRHKQANPDSEIWKEFYNRAPWVNGNFSAFGLDTSNTTEHQFSYQANNKENLILPEFENNDASSDNNIHKFYWFITSHEAWNQENAATWKPSKENIVIPKLSDFNDKTQKITRTGYIHIYLLISGFRIDFSAEISFVFQKVTDKNGKPLVAIDPDTTNIPYGQAINPEDPSPVSDTRIANVVIEEK